MSTRSSIRNKGRDASPPARSSSASKTRSIDTSLGSTNSSASTTPRIPDKDDTTSNGSRYRTRHSNGNTKYTVKEGDDHNEVCEVCETGGELLCCDTCSLVFHLGCIIPKMHHIPRGKWSCADCILDGSAEGNKERAEEAKKTMTPVSSGPGGAESEVKLANRRADSGSKRQTNTSRSSGSGTTPSSNSSTKNGVEMAGSDTNAEESSHDYSCHPCLDDQAVANECIDSSTQSGKRKRTRKETSLGTEGDEDKKDKRKEQDLTKKGDKEKLSAESIDKSDLLFSDEALLNGDVDKTGDDAPIGTDVELAADGWSVDAGLETKVVRKRRSNSKVLPPPSTRDLRGIVPPVTADAGLASSSISSGKKDKAAAASVLDKPAVAGTKGSKYAAPNEAPTATLPLAPGAPPATAGLMMPPVQPVVSRGRGRPFGSNKKPKLPLPAPMSNSIGSNLQRRAASEKGAAKRLQQQNNPYGADSYYSGKHPSQASVKAQQNSYLETNPPHGQYNGKTYYGQMAETATYHGSHLNQHSELGAFGIDAALKVIESAGKRLLKSNEKELLSQLRKWGPVLDLSAAVAALVVQKEAVLQKIRTVDPTFCMKDTPASPSSSSRQGSLNADLRPGWEAEPQQGVGSQAFTGGVGGEIPPNFMGTNAEVKFDKFDDDPDKSHALSLIANHLDGNDEDLLLFSTSANSIASIGEEQGEGSIQSDEGKESFGEGLGMDMDRLRECVNNDTSKLDVWKEDDEVDQTVLVTDPKAIEVSGDVLDDSQQEYGEEGEELQQNEDDDEYGEEERDGTNEEENRVCYDNENINNDIDNVDNVENNDDDEDMPSAKKRSMSINSSGSRRSSRRMDVS